MSPLSSNWNRGRTITLAWWITLRLPGRSSPSSTRIFGEFHGKKDVDILKDALLRNHEGFRHFMTTSGLIFHSSPQRIGAGLVTDHPRRAAIDPVHQRLYFSVRQCSIIGEVTILGSRNHGGIFLVRTVA